MMWVVNCLYLLQALTEWECVTGQNSVFGCCQRRRGLDNEARSTVVCVAAALPAVALVPLKGPSAGWNHTMWTI